MSKYFLKSTAYSLLVFTVLSVAATQTLRAQPSIGLSGINGFVEPQNPNDSQCGDWYLGVYGNYTARGLHLTQVYPRTAAEAFGLEVGDKIVAVNGQRISLLYPLDLALQSTRNGWVRLLVQDRRTNELLNVNVRLTRHKIHY